MSVFSKFLVSVICIAVLASCASKPKANPDDYLKQLLVTPFSPEDYALDRMTKAGLPKDFMAAFTQSLRVAPPKRKKNVPTDPLEKIVSLNVLGFLSHGDYSKHYSDGAVKKIKDFIKHNRKSLALAEKTDQVPKEVLASLLWVETQFGKHTGTFTLPQVYFRLLQANHPQIAKRTILELNQRSAEVNALKPQLTEAALYSKVIDRSNKKSDWALQQLVSISNLYQKGFHGILRMKSSFAGAFGKCQFIPSTYEKYAKSPIHQDADLFDIRDAIFSVANFLHENGWNNDIPTSKNNALFEYNRIHDYGDVILKLAEASRSK